jgi:hypothetical protein
MSYNEKIKQYIEDITKELPHSKYASRFGEELLEHLEDSEQDFKDENETILLEKMIEKIGSKKDLINEYNRLDTSRFRRLRKIEIIFCSLSSLPVWIALVLIIIKIESLTIPETPSSTLISIFTTIAFITFFLIYRYAIIRLARYYRGTKGFKVLLITLLLQIILYIFTEKTGFFIFIALLGFLGFWLSISYSMPKNKDLIYKIKYSILIIFNIILGFIFLGSMWGDGGWGEIIFTLFAIIELCIFWLFIYYLQIKSKSPSHRIKLLSLIILINSILGLYSFLNHSRVEEPKINWQIPVINISENIERRELGWLFPFFPNYDNSDRFDSYRPSFYNIESQNEGFIVSHISKKDHQTNNYWIKTINISSIYNIDIKELKELKEYIPIAEYNKPPLIDDFSCTRENGEVTTLTGFYSGREKCVELKYNGKYIWKGHYTGYIVGIDQSQDNNWVIITIDRDKALFLYLIDLRMTR